MLAPGALSPRVRGSSWIWRLPRPISRWLLASSTHVDGETPSTARRSARSLTTRGGPDRSAAVAQLYQRYAPTVLAYLHARLPAMADAEDLLAEVFIAALRAVDGGESLGISWLMTVARHRVADYYRRRSRPGSHTLSSEGMDDAPAGDSDDPEWLALRAEERRELLGLIRRLPEEQQDLLALRFAAGLRCPQIAQLMGLTEDTVRKRLSRTLSLLRKEWAR